LQPLHRLGGLVTGWWQILRFSGWCNHIELQVRVLEDRGGCLSGRPAFDAWSEARPEGGRNGVPPWGAGDGVSAVMLKWSKIGFEMLAR